MGFDFESKKSRKVSKKAKEPQKIDSKTAEYRDRAKADKKRYMMAVNSNYWLSFSFASKNSFDIVASKLCVDEQGYTFGDVLREHCRKPSDVKRSFKSRREKLDNPRISVIDSIGWHESDGTLNGDALAMAAALIESFESGFAERKSVYSSPYRIEIIFRDEDDMKSFCNEYKLGALEPPYINGDRACKMLGLL